MKYSVRLLARFSGLCCVSVGLALGSGCSGVAEGIDAGNTVE